MDSAPAAEKAFSAAGTHWVSQVSVLEPSGSFTFKKGRCVMFRTRRLNSVSFGIVMAFVSLAEAVLPRFWEMVTSELWWAYGAIAVLASVAVADAADLPRGLSWRDWRSILTVEQMPFRVELSKWFAELMLVGVFVSSAFSSLQIPYSTEAAAILFLGTILCAGRYVLNKALVVTERAQARPYPHCVHCDHIIGCGTRCQECGNTNALSFGATA